VEFEEDGSPASKRQRIQYAEMPGHHAYAQVVTDEASVAAIQAMDGTLTDMQHITEGTQITIPVAIATESGIEVHDARGLQHSIALSENEQMPVTHTLVEGNGHEIDIGSSVSPNTVVVTSLEGSTVVTQASEGTQRYHVVHAGLPGDEEVTEVVHVQMVKEEGEEMAQEVANQENSENMEGGIFMTCNKIRDKFSNSVYCCITYNFKSNDVSARHRGLVLLMFG
jgi:hypothetical protein